MATGSRLGPYELTELLGAGGMREVYRARDTRLDRIVAVKILPEHFADDPTARESGRSSQGRQEPGTTAPALPA